MWLLWFCTILLSAFYSEAGFGTPYLLKSRLCDPWSCVSDKLGLPRDHLPSREEYTVFLKSLLPEPWLEKVETVLDTCYNDRPRNYVSTCPSQALLHCTVDNLIGNCPEESQRKDDGCYPVSSLAGTKYMFTQSRYENLEANLPKEKRPAWFMRNYFNSKCCNLPKLINSTILKECGFTSFINYYDHKPRTENFMEQTNDKKQAAASTNNPIGKIIYDFSSITARTDANDGNQLKIVPLPVVEENDPLDCCDITSFIHPTWRSECGFHLTWNAQNRLTVRDRELTSTSTVPPTTTARVLVNKDVRVVPLSCEKESCVFRKLNIVSETGSVDMEAFSKLLDNFTAIHPSFAKAKARVITVCLARQIQGYDAACEINKVLGCTLDVLSENCPYETDVDTCRHSRRNNTICQVSSSMYRPKNRRAVCGLPNLVNSEVLTACGLTAVSRTEYAPEPPVVKPFKGWRNSKYACKDATPPTICLMSKMGILNKYGFMDYFSMKDRIRDFTSRHEEWSALTEVYMNTFTGMPMYKEHCNSPKKLLNVLDAMLMTCPVSKRKNTAYCTKLFFDITNTSPVNNQNITKAKLNGALEHWQQRFLDSTTRKPTEIVTRKNPIFDFGILHSKDVPPVATVAVVPKQIPVILPVYMRLRSNPLKLSNASNNQNKHGIFQSASFSKHGAAPNYPTTEHIILSMP